VKGRICPNGGGSSIFFFFVRGNGQKVLPTFGCHILCCTRGGRVASLQDEAPTRRGEHLRLDPRCRGRGREGGRRPPPGPGVIGCRDRDPECGGGHGDCVRPRVRGRGRAAQRLPIMIRRREPATGKKRQHARPPTAPPPPGGNAPRRPPFRPPSNSRRLPRGASSEAERKLCRLLAERLPFTGGGQAAGRGWPVGLVSRRADGYTLVPRRK